MIIFSHSPLTASRRRLSTLLEAKLPSGWENNRKGFGRAMHSTKSPATCNRWFGKITDWRLQNQGADAYPWVNQP